MVFLSGVIGVVPEAGTSRAGAQSPAVITMLHGIPGRTVDVVVGGTVLIAGLQPGETRDLSAFAGRTLVDVEVLDAGATTVLVGPIAKLPVPASGNVTVVAHAKSDGTFTLTSFVNQVTAPPAGQGRLTFRHLAAAPPVDLRSGATTIARSVANPAEASVALSAGKLSRLTVAISSSGAVIAIPELDLPAGANLIVHAVGSVAGDDFTILTQIVQTTGSGSGSSTPPAGPVPTTAVTPTTAVGPAPTVPGTGPVTLPTVGTGATPTTTETGATSTVPDSGGVPVPVRIDTGFGEILPDRTDGYPVGRVALLISLILVAVAVLRAKRDLGLRAGR